MRFAVIPLLLFACKGDSGKGDGTGTNAIAGTTWHADVRPLADVHCAGCHTEGGIAPFTFDDPQAIEVLGALIVQEVENGTMPPWHYDDACQKIEGDLSLDQDTIDVFSAWAANDYALGDPKTYVWPGTSAAPTPRAHDLEAWPQAPMVPDTSEIDHYVCTATDLVFGEETFIAETEVLPDRIDLVHHVIVYAVPLELMGEVERIAGGDVTQQFDCYGSPLGEIGTAIGGWVPGTQVSEVPEDAAIRVPPGAQVFVEMHYNTLSAEITGQDSDNTGLRLWTLPRASVDTLLIDWAAYDYRLDIPAGDASWDETSTGTLPLTGDLVSSSPHMHLLGTRARSDIRHASGDTSCVSDVAWDFDWQRTYAFTNPIPVTAGDQIDLTCTYDNSAANQPVVDGEQIAPGDVAWGDGSLDEMCIDFLQVAVPFDADMGEGICGGFDLCYADCDPSDGACILSCMAQVGGAACFVCGADAIFGDCAVDACPIPAFQLNTCYTGCGEATYNDVYGCLTDTCGPLLDSYLQCAMPRFEDGTCASDLAPCTGLHP